MAGASRRRGSEDDQALSAYYNERSLAGGKWQGFQTQAKLAMAGALDSEFQLAATTAD